MRQIKTFPLLRASQVNALHPYEIQPPGLVTAKNVYISPSDNAVTLRHDYYTFRNDIPTLVDHWAGSSSADKSDFLNILLTGPVYTDQQCITRLFPTGIGGTVLSSTYIDGTITTTGSSAVVTGSGTTWVKNVWPGSFIQFAGSANIYLILRVESDTSLTVDGTPSALSGVTYKVYRTHDYERGLYPGHFDQLANNYVYNMATPFDNDSDSINSICGPFTMVKPIARVPEIQELLNSSTPVIKPVESVDVYSSSGNGICKVVNNATRYVAISIVRTEVPGLTAGQGKVYNGSFSIITSTDGSTWVPATEIIPTIPDGYVNENPVNHEKYGNGVQHREEINRPTLRYISGDAFYIGYCQILRRFTGVGTAAVYGYIDGKHVIYRSVDGLTWTEWFSYLYTATIPNSMTPGAYAPDVAFKTGNYYVVCAGGRLYRFSNPTAPELVYPETGASSMTHVVYNGTNFVAVAYNKVIISSDGETWTNGIIANIQGYIVTAVEIGKSNHIWVILAYAGNTGTFNYWRQQLFLSTNDGASFTAKAAFDAQVGGIAYDATDDLTVFVGCGSVYSTATRQYSWTSNIQTSSNESTFTSRAIPSGNIYLADVCPFSGATTGWVAVGLYGVIINSANGTSWAKVFDIERTPDIFSVCRLGSALLICGEYGSIAYGSNNWNFLPILTDKDFYDIYQINGPAIACGETGTIKTADQINSWTSRTSGVTVTLRGIAWDFVDSSSTRVIVIVGDATAGAGVVLTSSDLITWTGRTSNTTKSLNDVCHNQSNLFVAVGEDGAIIASADGTTWAAKTSGTAEDLNGVCYSRPLLKFCAVGDAGTVLISTDGTTWAAATSGVSKDLHAVTWTGSSLVAVGASGTMIESQDGVTWTILDTDTTATLYDVIGIGDYRLAFGVGGIVVKVFNTTLSSQWIPVSDVYRASGFAVAAGYLVLVGTSEFENGRWVYHPRRIRWTTPGTIDDFTSEGSGATDLQGTGQISDARALGYNIILFESSQISCLNSTDDIFSPWSYQVIHAQMRCISNPLVIDQQCYFISPDGKLQRTNGFNVTEVCQPFDLTKYKDFDDAGPIWLTYDREMRRILCYRPRKTDDEHLMFVIDPENATMTSVKLEDVTVAGGGYYQGASGINFARSVPQIPTDYKFISTLELDDVDGDGEPETPVRVPFETRWLVNDKVTQADYFRAHCWSATDAQFVICGHGGRIYTIATASVAALPTINGVSDCTARTSGTAENLEDIGYDGTYYVAVGTNSTIIRSTDGITWVPASSVGTRDAADWIYSVLDSTTAGFIIASAEDSVSGGYYILKSTDNGDTWTDTGDGDYLAYELNYLNSKYWIFGEGAQESTDGVTWITYKPGTITTGIQAGYYKNSTYYISGENKWFYSPAASVGATRTWFESDHPVTFTSNCGEGISGIDSAGDIMVIGTALNPYYYYYWTDNGSRFFRVPKPAAATNTYHYTWSLKWNGTYLLALATDAV